MSQTNIPAEASSQPPDSSAAVAKPNPSPQPSTKPKPSLEERIDALEKTQFRFVTIASAVVIAFGIFGIDKWRSIPQAIDAKVSQKVSTEVAEKVGTAVLNEIETNRRKIASDAIDAGRTVDQMKRWASTRPVVNADGSGVLTMGDVQICWGQATLQPGPVVQGRATFEANFTREFEGTPVVSFSTNPKASVGVNPWVAFETRVTPAGVRAEIAAVSPSSTFNNERPSVHFIAVGRARPEESK